MSETAIRRVDFGYFVRPSEETATGKARVEPASATWWSTQMVYSSSTPAWELAEARNTADYTLPELLEGGRFEEITGDSEVLPGVFLMPTPGHTSGHQSLIVRRADGAVILAGQSHDTASDYAADRLAWRAQRDTHDQTLPEGLVWMKRLQDLDPRVIYFAHDHSIWVP